MISISEGNGELALSVLRRSDTPDVPDAEGILAECMERSVKVCCGWYDDHPACMWGLIPPTLLSDRAYLWLITTDIVTEHKFLFIRHSQRYVEAMLEVYPLLFGDVAVNNKTAQRWLKWLGARFKEPIKGMIPFEIRKRNE